MRRMERERKPSRHASQVADEERFSRQTTFAVLLCEHDKCFAYQCGADSILARKCIPLCLSNEFTFVRDKRLPMAVYTRV